MRENRLKRIWQNGGVAINGWLQIPDSYAAEMMAHQGWDSLTLDMQHGFIDVGSAVPILQAVSTTDVVPLIRVPALDPPTIMRSLDAGAYGIICPMISTRQEAEMLVSACRYPPDGVRSAGPLRGLLYGGADYVVHANETVLAVAMIETRQAVENLDDILSTPGLDAIYIGPSDLSLAFGAEPRPDIEEGPMAEKIDDILAAAKRHGIVAGLHSFTPSFAAKAGARGFQLVTTGTDAKFIAEGARAAVEIVSRALC